VLGRLEGSEVMMRLWYIMVSFIYIYISDGSFMDNNFVGTIVFGRSERKLIPFLCLVYNVGIEVLR
jgi:hypothetical protein